MHPSLSPFCHLCAASSDGASLTNVYSDEGKRSNLHVLINQYISPIIFLPKQDKLCVCDTCKTRLQMWDSFIDSCKKAQKKLNDTLEKDQHADLLSPTKRQIGPDGLDVSPSSSSSKKRKSSTYCIARWCNNHNYQGISLFRLPRERDRALMWLSAAERTDLQCKTVLHSYYLCAKHFTSNMFTNKVCNQLIKKAIPTVFPRSPYANKTTLTAATSLVQPTQLQGVQLKYILPKISLPKNPLPQPTMIVMDKTQKVLAATKNLKNSVDTILVNLSPEWPQGTASMDAEQNSGLVINVIPSERRETVDTYGSVMNITELAAPSVLDQNSSTSDLPQNDSGTSAGAVVQENCNSLVKWSTSSSLNQVVCHVPMTESPTLCADMPSHLESKNTTCSGNGSSKVKPCVKKVRKLYLEELEECLTSDAFNEGAMLSADCTSESLKPKMLKISSTTNGDSCTITRSPSPQPTDNYQSSVGSQDFLLPHVSVKLDELSPSCSAPSDVTNEVSREELKEQIIPVSHEINPNSSASLFDLHTDHTHVTDNSSFIINNIVNLDELMDLDHYFEER